MSVGASQGDLKLDLCRLWIEGNNKLVLEYLAFTRELFLQNKEELIALGDLLLGHRMYKYFDGPEEVSWH